MEQHWAAGQAERGLVLPDSCKYRSCDGDVGNVRCEGWVWWQSQGVGQKQLLGMQRQQVIRKCLAETALQKELLEDHIFYKLFP